MKVVLYGSGTQGQAICQNFAQSFDPGEYELLGFLDSDTRKLGIMVCGKPVLALEDVKKIEDILIIIAIASPKAREEVTALLAREGLSSRVFSLDGPMNRYYTNEANTQILIALLKEYGIKKVIASPGATNVSFVASVQHDTFFEIYSSVDERSAAYIACGLAVESGEPVVLSCTGATASRNYLPGLTEAYYSKLPVLAITSSQHSGRKGQLFPQMTDRSSPPEDTVKIGVDLPAIYSAEERWACETKINQALLELKRDGGGPVHINLQTTYSRYFTKKNLPVVRRMERFGIGDTLPKLDAGRAGVFVGAHKRWSKSLIRSIDRFCEKYNAVVFCDHSSNYQGKYRVLASLVCSQDGYHSPCRNMDVMIHIGEVSGSYVTLSPKEIWRVSPDGEIRDVFKRLKYVFEMDEQSFFEAYADAAPSEAGQSTYFDEWRQEHENIAAKIPKLPFSNLWIAQQTSRRLPENSILHLGILNTLRCWNFFETPGNIYEHANTGGFGIDGCVSTAIGTSLAAPNKLVFAVVGDLAFFYDMNSIGNRHVKSNLRLLVVNNGCGTEFKNYNHIASMFGEDTDIYIAASGHFGNKSPDLLKDYARSLGFEYLCASNKEQYLSCLEYFVDSYMKERPILFEVFTDSDDESEALRMIRTLAADNLNDRIAKGKTS